MTLASEPLAGAGAWIKAMVDGWAAYSEDEETLTRVFLSPQHKACAQAVMSAMRAAGMSARIDAVGNVVGRYEAETEGAEAADAEGPEGEARVGVGEGVDAGRRGLEAVERVAREHRCPAPANAGLELFYVYLRPLTTRGMPARSRWARATFETSRPSPGSMLMTPGGMPASSSSSIVSDAASCWVGDGFQITVLPISAGAVGRLPAIAVKLKGVIA